MQDTGRTLSSASLIHLIANLDECIELCAPERPSVPDIRLKSILVAMRREMVHHLAQRIDAEEGEALPDGSASPFGVLSLNRMDVPQR
jgi:hypothetical protein